MVRITPVQRVFLLLADPEPLLTGETWGLVLDAKTLPARFGQIFKTLLFVGGVL